MSRNQSDFEKRMKEYESIGTSGRLIPTLATCIRLDGKNFHNFCKGFDKPYDTDIQTLFDYTTLSLMEESNATIGYTQSDEITLIFYSDNHESQIFFDGKVQKMVSVLSSYVTVYFNLTKDNYPILKDKHPALFDCRVWSVPTKQEAVNYFIWREKDAVRNSIQSVGQANFSHKELNKKSQKQIQEMLFQEKGINWNDYSLVEKRGRYLQRYIELRKFTTDEIDKLPPKHEAHKNPNLKVERSSIRQLKFKTLVNDINQTKVLFEGAEPLTEKQRIEKINKQYDYWP